MKNKNWIFTDENMRRYQDFDDFDDFGMHLDVKMKDYWASYKDTILPKLDLSFAEFSKAEQTFHDRPCLGIVFYNNNLSMKMMSTNGHEYDFDVEVLWDFIGVESVRWLKGGKPLKMKVSADKLGDFGYNEVAFDDDGKLNVHLYFHGKMGIPYECDIVCSKMKLIPAMEYNSVPVIDNKKRFVRR